MCRSVLDFHFYSIDFFFCLDDSIIQSWLLSFYSDKKFWDQYFKVVLAISSLSHFYMNFKVILSVWSDPIK